MPRVARFRFYRASPINPRSTGEARVSPASKDSIQAMPRVLVTEEGSDCPICLETFKLDGKAREMPCKHRFHSGCIEKWLGIHGSCPICRFLMPVEKKRIAAQQGGGDNGVGLFSVSLWVRSADGDDVDDPMDVDSDLGQGLGRSDSDSREGNFVVHDDDDDSSRNQEPQDMEF